MPGGGAPYIGGGYMPGGGPIAPVGGAPIEGRTPMGAICLAAGTRALLPPAGGGPLSGINDTIVSPLSKIIPRVRRISPRLAEEDPFVVLLLLFSCFLVIRNSSQSTMTRFMCLSKARSWPSITRPSVSVTRTRQFTICIILLDFIFLRKAGRAVKGAVQNDLQYPGRKMEEDWLAHPVLIDPSLEENQSDLTEFEPNLSPRIISALREAGFHSLFPVQKAVLNALGQSDATDLLVSASTGSGKTLAYTLPIVNALSSRLVVRLRALIVVPGRELAQQVASVMEPFTSAVGLSMAVVVGQTSMIAEQKKLVASVDSLQGGSSNVDILIATPGRLVDHLQMTPNFTLQHLQFLVIDEADRLLDQNFQDWLPKVLKSAEGKLPEGLQFIPVSDAVSFRENQASLDSIFGLNCWATPLRKMLFSATLTKNPAKLAQLKLNNPKFLSVSLDHSKYTVPDGLEEFMVVAEDGEKVHSLLYLLQKKSLCRALCFTKSIESTDKLCNLLQTCMSNQKDRICSFSSDVSAAQRIQILEKFNLGEVDLLICSDGAARGLDLEGVSAVINYDVPIHAKTYIHRVGRTARAGASGVAFSLLESREAHHFKQMLVQGRSGKSAVQKLKIKPEDIEPIRSIVEEAMGRLQGELILQTVVQQFSRT